MTHRSPRPGVDSFPTPPTKAEEVRERRRRAERMYYYRHKLGLSQQEVAVRIGATRAAVSAYETGKRDPSVPVMMMYVQALGLNPLWWCIGLGTPALSDDKASRGTRLVALHEVRRIIDEAITEASENVLLAMHRKLDGLES